MLAVNRPRPSGDRAGLLAPPARPARKAGQRGRPLRVGLLNNMPDSAFAQTERQFRRLLGDACDVSLLHLRGRGAR